MPSPITKETLEHLAELARLELKPEEEEKLLRDLQKILGHFEELKSLDTAHVAPISGGTELLGVFRGDEERRNTNLGAGAESFPEAEDGLLKVPRVFEE